MLPRTYLLALLGLMLFACEKFEKEKEVEQGLPTSPETKPQYDNTNFGVYKGVIIGSSGWIVLKINNGDNIVRGYLEMDDQRDTLTTDSPIVLGEPISNVLFKGRISSLKLSINAYAANAWITDIQINGHDKKMLGFIMHEKSNNQVFCYKGTFTGTAIGIVSAARLANGDTTFMLSKISQIVRDGLILDQTYADTIYVGYGWNLKDSLIGAVYPAINPPYSYHSVSSSTNINGNFEDKSSVKSTFNGTWWSSSYGNGELSMNRIY